MIQSPRNSWYVLLVMIPIILLLSTGCSVSDNPAATSSDQNIAQSTDRPAEGAPSPYPAWTEADLASLIPGYQILKVDTRAYERDGQMDDQVSRRIYRTIGGTVNHRNCGVQIGAWQLWEDQTVTVSTPIPGQAIVDFYPHPYQFNGCIRMWIDLTYVQLPAGMRWDQLCFFYVEADGHLTQYWGQIDLAARRYYAWPDHFSRYIIAAPVSN
jgi:hypothetical protein